MSHILVIGGGISGLFCALKGVSKGLTVTLVAARPILHNRAILSPNLGLPDDADRRLRRYGAQSMNGHEVLSVLLRQSREFTADGRLTILPYRRATSFILSKGVCVGAIIFDERTETLESMLADAVILAVGGIDPLRMEGAGDFSAVLAMHAGAQLENSDQSEHIGIRTDAHGQTARPGLYAIGSCTTYSRSASDAMQAGESLADYLAAEADFSGADHYTAEQAAATQLMDAQQILDTLRDNGGTRSEVTLERHLREAMLRALPNPRTAPPLARGLLDLRVLRQQASRGGFDLGAGFYPVLRLPALITLAESTLLTAAYRMTQEDGRLTASLFNGNIEIAREVL